MKSFDSHVTDQTNAPSVDGFRKQLLDDYRLVCVSREASLLGRKEVLGGKAKFGIFGDGKELAQIALSKVLKPGDWRSGYYRDQTLMLGLAQASKLYRSLPEVAKKNERFTNQGNEIAVGTIGDASTSEGPFWETMNAACVLQVPMLMNVWDDGYGISVPKEFQTTKASISQALRGMEIQSGTNGMVIYQVKGWDYPDLVATYEAAEKRCREEHVPVLVHVEDLTQPQGHSTSGSHERYKSAERMAWAKEYDCIEQFGLFLILEGAATADELDAIRKESKKRVREEQKVAWAAFRAPIEQE